MNYPRCKYRICVVTDGQEYLNRTGYDTYDAAKEVVRNIDPSLQPHILKVVRGETGKSLACPHHGMTIRDKQDCPGCRGLDDSCVVEWRS